MGDLYLMGGIWAGLDPVAEHLAGRTVGDTVVFLAQDASGWSEHRDFYTEPFRAAGFTSIDVVAPGDSGTLDVPTATSTIRHADVLFVCGGEVQRYRDLYAIGDLADVLRESYRRGTPYVGLSAGAMIAPEQIAPLTETHDPFPTLQDGLGLVDDLLVSVHQTQRDQTAALRDFMQRHDISRGLAIGDRGCVRLEHGEPVELLSGDAEFLERP